MKLRTFLLPLMLSTLLPVQADELPGVITIGTGSVTGVYYPAGGAICRLLNRDESATTRCAVESTGGSRDNLSLLAKGEIELAFVQSDLLWEAVRGQGAYAGKPLRDMTTLFSLYVEPLNLVVRGDSDIQQLEDLKGKRVGIGNPGSGDRATVDALLAALGWDAHAFAAVDESKAAERVEALCSGKTDAFFMVAAHPNQTVTEAVTECNARLVPLEGDAINTLLANFPYYSKVQIPGGLYRMQDQALTSFGTTALLVARQQLPATLVYRIDQEVFNQFEAFKRLHPAFAHLRREQMLANAFLPFHPGSAAFLAGTPPVAAPPPPAVSAAQASSAAVPSRDASSAASSQIR